MFLRVQQLPGYCIPRFTWFVVIVMLLLLVRVDATEGALGQGHMHLCRWLLGVVKRRHR